MKNIFSSLLFFIALSLHSQQAETLIQLGHSDRVHCVYLTPNGKFAVTGSSDHTIKLWNISNGQLIRTFNGHHGLIYGVQVSKDGKTIYSCSWDDRRVIKWDALTGKILKQYVNYNSPVSGIALSNDNKNLACRNDQGIIILSTADLSTYKKISLPNPRQIIFSDDDMQLFIANDNYKKEKVLIFNMISGAFNDSIPSIYSPESMSISKDKIILSNYKEIACYDLNTKQKVLGLPKSQVQEDEDNPGPVRALRFNYACINKAGTMIAYGLEDGSIYAMSLDGNPVKDVTGKTINFEKKHDGFINQLQFSDDGKFLITASNDWTSKVYSVPTGKVVRNLAARIDIYNRNMKGAP